MKTNLRTIALLALVFLAIRGTALSENAPGVGTTLVILANRETQRRLWPVLVSTLRVDAAAASKTSPIDPNVQITLLAGDEPGPNFPSRIEVELLGNCDDPWNSHSPLHAGPLGWVLRDSGKIEPVIYIDCAQVNQEIWPKTRSTTQKQRLQATSEAISHVILHEWIHIATQNPAHASHGIMQPELSLQNLTTPIEAKRTPQCNSQSRPIENVVFLRHWHWDWLLANQAQ